MTVLTVVLKAILTMTLIATQSMVLTVILMKICPIRMNHSNDDLASTVQASRTENITDFQDFTDTNSARNDHWTCLCSLCYLCESDKPIGELGLQTEFKFSFNSVLDSV